MKHMRNPYVSLILAYLMIILPPVPLWAGAASYPRGDLNGDRFIDVQDTIVLRDLLLGKPLDARVPALADFNVDTRTDVADLVALVNYDGDWDGDAIPDLQDDYPLDPDHANRTLAENNLDADSDGYADLVHAYRVDSNAVLAGGSMQDSDGDGILNTDEDSGWSNTHGGPFITDSVLSDTDRDGLNDGAERSGGMDPLNPDTDGDGVVDGDDSTPLNSAIRDAAKPLTDAEGSAKGMRRLTPTQMEINRKWQAERLAQMKEQPSKSTVATSGRGLGFQGPEAVGSSFESVHPDPFSGAFSYAIPLKVPPGRAGFQPDLSLLYRSTHAHSWLGNGWELNPGRIERSSRYGVPKYHNPSAPPVHDDDPFTPLDNPDTYVYRTAAGAQELVFTGTEVIGDQSCGIYHAEIDSGSFVRFIHHPDPANPGGGGWEVWWKDGRKAWFHRDFHVQNSVIATADGRIYAWGIEREEDVNGNRIEYSYQHPADTNAMYIERIQYNFVDSVPMVELTFELERRSPSTETWASYRESYRAGFQIVSEHFLTGITEVVKHRDAVEVGLSERVRRYAFQYHTLDYPAGRTIACLKSVQEFGSTDDVSFPAVTLEYSLLDKGFALRESGLPDAGYPFLASSGNTGTEVMDLDGDGLTDVLRLISNYDTRYIWRVALNQGTSFAGNDWHAYLPGSFWFAFWGMHRGGDIGTRVTDLDGDGFQDLVHLQKTHTGAFVKKQAINTGAGFREGSGLVESGLPSSNEIFLVYTPDGGSGVTVGGSPMDINGDGLTDFLRLDESRNKREAALNTGGGYVGTTSGIPTQDYTLLAASGHTGTQVMDINGDGLTDMVRLIASGNNRYVWRVAFNKGTGFIESDWHSSLPDSFWMAFWGINRGGDIGTRVMDINGDGLLDLVHLQKTHASPYYVRLAAINTGAKLWENADFGLPLPAEPSDLVFVYTPEDGQGQDVGTRILDVNGDGLADIVRHQEGQPQCAAIKNGSAQAPAPNLLVKINNGIGGSVDIEYVPSNKAFMRLRDPASGQIEVTDALPYTMQVVAKVTRTGLQPTNINPSQPITLGTTSQSYATLYRYAGGQHLDHEFRGFQKVKEIDAQTGNFTITEFHQDYARKGRVKATRSYVGHRDDYRYANGTIIKPSDEKQTLLKEPVLVKESATRYRVIVHADDPLYLKTFTDTDTKLGLTDFPKGMTLVTPACTLTRTYEYSGRYEQNPADLRDDQIVVTAREEFFDGRGNPTQQIDFGQVHLLTQHLQQPRLDVNFVNDTGAGADGRIVKMTHFEQRRLGTWMDMPTCTNTAGFQTNLATGARDSQGVHILEATTLDYDDLNRPIVETFCLDGGADPIVRQAYDTYGNRTRLTDPRGNQTLTLYDARYHGFPVTEINPLGHVEHFVVDPGYGHLLRLTDANGQTRTARYDDLGRVTARLDANGTTVTSYQYGFFGESTAAGVFLPNLLRTTKHTPTGSVWSEQHFDGLARRYQTLTLGQRGGDDPVRTATAYNDRGIAWKESHPHWMSEAANVHWSYTFLENDTAEKSTGVKQWDHPGQDRTWMTSHELNLTEDASSERVYESPLVIKTMLPRGAETRESRVIRDGFGNRIETWEPDELGSVGQPGAYEGRQTRWGHDALGRLQYVRRTFDPDFPDRDPVTRMSYDSLGRITHLMDPDTGTTLYDHYDAKGNLLHSVDARGIGITRQYDALDRLTFLTYPDRTTTGTLSHAYSYDRGEGQYLIGRLARVQSPACSIDYSYDQEGRIVRVRRGLDGQTYDAITQYDYAGRTTGMTYPDGMHLSYHYDPMTQALDAVTDPDTGQTWLADVQMSPFHAAASIKLGNGVTRTNTFDWSGRATRLHTAYFATTLSDLRYVFDRHSNITSIQELVGETPRGFMHYTYDSLDRLSAAWGTTMSGVDVGDAIRPHFRFRYDPLGRMIANSRFENPAAYADYTLEYEYSSNPESDRPAQAVRGIRFTKAAAATVYAHTFEYDAAGNLLGSSNEPAAIAGNDLERAYTWDALGRLDTLTHSAGTISFTYDHAKERVRKTGPTGERVTYVGDLMEVAGTRVTKHIFAGPLRIATITSTGRKLFYMTDHLRSSTLITDQAGNVVQRMDYAPYGDLIENGRSGNAAGIRHTYTGQEDDVETGLMYYGARYYDPVVAMFVSADALTRRPDAPQRFEEPDHFATAFSNPQQLNRYAYGTGNPMGFTDDTGEFVVTALVIGIVAGAAIGAASAAAQHGSTRDILIGAGIGAAAGLVGGGVGIAAGGLGAVAAGGLAGFSGGFTGGLLTGFNAAGWQGAAWQQAVTMGAIEGGAGMLVGGGGGKVGSMLTKWGAGKHAGGTLGKPIGQMSRSEVMAKGDMLKATAKFTQDWGHDIDAAATGLLEAPVMIPTAPQTLKLQNAFGDPDP